MSHLIDFLRKLRPMGDDRAGGEAYDSFDERLARALRREGHLPAPRPAALFRNRPSRSAA